VIDIWREGEWNLSPAPRLNHHLIRRWIGRGQIRVEVDVPPHPVRQLQGSHAQPMVGSGLEQVGVVVVVVEGRLEPLRLELEDGVEGRRVVKDEDARDLLRLDLLESSGCLAGGGRKRVELAKQLLVLHLELG